MTYKEFVKSIGPDTPEKILFQVGFEQLKDYATKLSSNAYTQLLFEDGRIEGIYFSDKAFFLVCRKGKKFFQLDVTQYGITVAELLPTEEIEFWDVALEELGR